MPSSFYRLFEAAFQIRADEFRRVQLFFLYFALIGMYYTVGSTAGETLFLARLGSAAAERYLPWVYIGIAAATAGVTLCYDYLESRVSRIRLLVGSHVLLAGSLLLFRWAVLSGWTPVFFGLTIWVESCDLFAMAIFFSFAGDYFTTRDARRLYGYITGGLAVGIFTSGYAVEPLVGWLGTERLLYICAALLLGCAAMAYHISRVEKPLEKAEGEESEQAPAVRKSVRPAPAGLPIPQAPLKTVFSSRYLQLAFLLVLLCSLATVLADYEMKIVVSRQMQEEQMAVYFGKFYGYMGLASVLVQFLLVGWLLGRLGIIKSLLILPGLLLLSSVAAFVSPTLLMVTASNFILLTLAETLDLPAQELLFLPLSSRLRLRAQTLVDGALNPIGHGIGGVLLLLLALVNMKLEYVALIVAVIAGLWLAFVFVMKPHYQKTLATSLRQRQLSPLDLEALLTRGDSRAAVRSLLGSKDPDLAISALDLLRGRPLGDFAAAIAALAASPHEAAAVRALELLAGQGGAEQLPAVRRSLQDARVPVRAAALLALCRIAQEDAVTEAAAHLDSQEPALRAAALIGLARYGGFDGALVAYPRLEARLKSAAESDRVEAARILGQVGLRGAARALERLLKDASLPVRLEALRCAQLLRSPGLVPSLLEALADPRLRPLAIEALDALPHEAVGTLAGSLRDLELGYARRAVVVRALGAIGGPTVPALLWEFLACEPDLRLRLNAAHSLRRLRAREGLHGLALPGFAGLAAGLCERAALLQRALRDLGGDGAAAAFLADHARLHIELMLALLSLRYDAHQLQRVEAHLFGDNPALRANAVELLEVLLPRDLAKPLAALLAEHEAPRAKAAGELSAQTAAGLLRADPWTRGIAVFHLAKGGAVRGSLGGETMDAQDLSLHQVLTTVSFLKNVGLFRRIPANYLANVAGIVAEKSLYAGETLFSQGDVGDSLYLIRTGRLRVLVGGKKAAELGPNEHIGEMALLDGRPRSATAEVAQDSRLLRIGADDFRNLLTSHPVISLALLETMALRLRETQAGGQAEAACGR